jgi:hypothetical protein
MKEARQTTVATLVWKFIAAQRSLAYADTDACTIFCFATSLCEFA